MTLSLRLGVYGLENSELVKLILLLGSIAGAIAALGALIAKIVKLVKKVIDYFKTLANNVNTLLEHDSEQYKQILKLTIVNENLPLSERITAAKKYFELGGNGDIHAYYEEHLAPYDHIEERKENE